MVTKVNNITSLPTLILKNITSFEFNNKEFNALMDSTNSESIQISYFEIMKDALYLSLIQRKDENFILTEKLFINFFRKYQESFELLGTEFKKKIN